MSCRSLLQETSLSPHRLTPAQMLVLVQPLTMQRRPDSIAAPRVLAGDTQPRQ